jgi:hypothetical protein
MKTLALATFALASAALLVLPSAQDKTTKDGPLERLSVVERDLAQAKDKLAKQEAELADLRAWVAAQQAAAKVMQSTLDESEKAGFTFGINPESRHALLRGWRSQLDAAGSEAKSAPKTAAEDQGSARAKRP